MVESVYVAKYGKSFFSMAKSLWSNPATKTFHRAKGTKTMEETDIKEKFVVAGVVRK